MICSEHPPSSDCSGKKERHLFPPLSFYSFSLLPIKIQTDSHINPAQFLSSAAVPIPDCARLGKSFDLFTPTHPPPNATTIHLPSYAFPPAPTPPSSFLLQNEMPMSDRLSQFADPCGTHPFRPGHCASRSLAKRRGIIFIPQTGGYAPMISNACLAHCQGWFWPNAKPILLYWSLFLCISIATDNADLLQNILGK